MRRISLLNLLDTIVWLFLILQIMVLIYRVQTGLHRDDRATMLLQVLVVIIQSADWKAFALCCRVVWQGYWLWPCPEWMPDFYGLRCVEKLTLLRVKGVAGAAPSKLTFQTAVKCVLSETQ
jgi:hypothetical protein